MIERLAKSEQRDLGQFELQDAGRIEGRVLMDSGSSAEAVSVVLDDWKDERTASTNAAGEFLFEGLAPGPHRVVADARSGAYGASNPAWVQVSAGGTGTVELDLRGRATVRVEVFVTVNGEPLEGAQVDLTVDGRPRIGSSGVLGRTDAEGRAVGDTSPGAAAQVAIHVGLLYLKPEAGRLDLRAGVDEIVRLDFELGTAEFRLPPGLDLEPLRGHHIELFAAESVGGGALPEDSADHSLSLTTAKGGLVRLAPGLFDGFDLGADSQHLRAANLPLGRYRYRWTVSDPEQPERTELPDGRIRFGHVILLVEEGEVMVEL